VQCSTVQYSLVKTAIANKFRTFSLFKKHISTELPRLSQHYEYGALAELLLWNLQIKFIA